MRIIAGRWRGTKLLSLKGDRIRPTTDRVKEAMFSILGPHLDGVTVLDLCCGTGGLGLEALSRGAEKVYFVDNSQASLAQVQRNLGHLGADKGSAIVCRAEAVKWFEQWLDTSFPEPWILVSDPPYSMDTAGEILSLLAVNHKMDGFMSAIIEHHRKDPPSIPETPGLSVQCRNYGSSSLTIVRQG